MKRDGGAVSQRHISDQSPFVIGLTGSIASGKSTVAEMLRQRGAEIIDADRVYRSLLIPESELSRQVVERFGPTIVRSDGEINRAALAEMVFTDPEALADLDRITHPAVIAEIRSRIAQSGAPVIVVEAVKLVQSGLASDVDALWLITADPETRLRRLMSRSVLDEASARSRIAASPDSVPEGIEFGATIDTSGDLTATADAVADAWRAVWFGQEQVKDNHLVPAQKEHS